MKVKKSTTFEDNPNERGASSRPAQERITGVRANDAVLTLSNYIISGEIEATQVIYQTGTLSNGIPLMYLPYGSSLTTGTFTVNPSVLNQIILYTDQQDNFLYNVWYRKSV